MNRKEKGWLAEAAVKRYYERRGHEVRNLAPAEPASDLLLIEAGEIVGEVEVKYGRKPSRLHPDEKHGIWEAKKRCDLHGRGYWLWEVTAQLGERGKVLALQGACYKVLGLEPAKARKGLSLSVEIAFTTSLPLPEGGQVTGSSAPVPLTPATEVRE